MKQEQKKKEKPRQLVLAAVGLCLGVALLLFGGFGGGDAAEEVVTESPEVYRQTLEASLTDLCSSVRGAGRVTVLVTLKGGYEYVYATDRNGGCVTVGSGSGERAVVASVRAPEIAGVGIVCAGADDPRVAEELCELVSAALGIGRNRIYVSCGS